PHPATPPTPRRNRAAPGPAQTADAHRSRPPQAGPSQATRRDRPAAAQPTGSEPTTPEPTAPGTSCPTCPRPARPAMADPAGTARTARPPTRRMSQSRTFRVGRVGERRYHHDALAPSALQHWVGRL